MLKRDNKLSKITHAFIRANRLHRACCDKLISQVNMHRNQHRILMNLAREGTQLSQKELAKRLEISTAAVAVMLKKLETEGYILKELSKEDNRFNEITITEKGREAVDKTYRYFNDIDKVMFDGLSKEELLVLEKCFSKMSDNLSVRLGR